MKTVLVCLIAFSVSGCSRPPHGAGEESAAAGPKPRGIVEMTLEAQSHIGLRVLPAEVRPLVEYLQVTGTVQPLDSKAAHIRPVASGRLLTVTAKVGDRVAAGEVLATFDNTEAADIVSQYQVHVAELEKLNVQLSIARQQSERLRQLAEIGAIPRKEYDLSLGEERTIDAGMDTQRKVIAGALAKLQRFGFAADTLASSTTASVRAPFAGVVLHADAAPGEIIRQDTELFRIVDTSQVWVQAEVYEKDLGRVRAGQTASISVDTYPGREFSGRVSYISDILDPQTRTARVRCEVSNTDGLLRLDMFATIRLPTDFRKDGLAVPSESLQQVEGRNVVFVRTGPTTFEQKTVQIGKTMRGVTEILGGLRNGEAVVTEGAFHLKSIVLGDQIGGEEH
jgi:cobalt-zinc-cadmium efflux system membrane fusion protein